MAKLNIDGYSDLEEISSGGFGTILRARGKLDRNRKVAIKVGISDKIDQERKLLKGMSHPNIVEVLDHGDGWYAMPEADGCLSEVIGTFSVEEAVEVGKQLASALDYMHNLSKPHVHKDIKPGNVLFVDGKAKLADMGLSQSIETRIDSYSRSNISAGTDHYIAPEVEKGEDFDHRADLFSLGMTLYELVTGDNRILKPIENENFNAIVSKLTESDPDNRYQSAKELIEDLEDLAGGVIASGMVEHPVIKPNKKSNYIPLTILLMTGAAASIIGAIYTHEYLIKKKPKKAPVVRKTENQNKPVKLTDWGSPNKKTTEKRIPTKPKVKVQPKPEPKPEPKKLTLEEKMAKEGFTDHGNYWLGKPETASFRIPWTRTQFESHYFLYNNQFSNQKHRADGYLPADLSFLVNVSGDGRSEGGITGLIVNANKEKTGVWRSIADIPSEGLKLPKRIGKRFSPVGKEFYFKDEHGRYQRFKLVGKKFQDRRGTILTYERRQVKFKEGVKPKQTSDETVYGNYRLGKAQEMRIPAHKNGQFGTGYFDFDKPKIFPKYDMEAAKEVELSITIIHDTERKGSHFYLMFQMLGLGTARYFQGLPERSVEYRRDHKFWVKKGSEKSTDYFIKHNGKMSFLRFKDFDGNEAVFEYRPVIK